MLPSHVGIFSTEASTRGTKNIPGHVEGLPSHVGVGGVTESCWGFSTGGNYQAQGVRGEIFSGFLDVSYRVGLWEFDVTAFG